MHNLLSFLLLLPESNTRGIAEKEEEEEEEEEDKNTAEDERALILKTF